MARCIKAGKEEFDLGQQIKKYRKLRNMTQDDLAERINTDRSNIGKIENGVRGKTKVGLLVRISKTLNVPLCVLLDLDGELEQIMGTIELLNHENRRIVQIASNALLHTQMAVEEKG